MDKARPPVFTIALVSASALAYEILLARLFAIIQWHHYAYMVISLALLGYGASGTLLTLFHKPLLAHYRPFLVGTITLFGLSMPICFLTAQSIQFNPEALLFDAAQWRNLAGMYLLLAVPFLFAATAIGLTLTRYREMLARVYGADLIGAAAGSMAIVASLFFLFPLQALQGLATLGAVTALVSCYEAHLDSRAAKLTLSTLVFIPWFTPASWIELSASPYKDLEQALRIDGSRVIVQHSSPLGLVSVVENTRIPSRHAPGLSLASQHEPPAQLGIYVDGNGPSVINKASADFSSSTYLGELTSALPYVVGNPEKVLVIGAGGGSAVLQARQLGSTQVDALELNPQVSALVRDAHAEFSGHLYQQPGVEIIQADARGFLARSDQRYDLIQIPVLDSFASSATGLHALGEDYLHTVEAIRGYLGHLEPGGVLAINRWVKMPPRDMLKLFATAIEALDLPRSQDAAGRLALVRGWQTSIILIKQNDFDARELAAIRAFCNRHSFDLAYLPDMHRDEANRFNILAQPYYFQAATQLLSDRHATFIERYKFNLQPASDDRPYFHHYFRWRTLPEIMDLFGRGGAPLVDSGYLVLIATLLQAIGASVVLILLPLILTRRTRRETGHRIEKGRVLVYFASLGLGFLFVEIAFIQKLTLLLHHPLYALAVSLAAFLFFAGLGSASVQRIAQDEHAWSRITRRAILGVVLISLLYLAALDFLIALLSGLSDPARIAFAIVLVAPLAFAMGIPFPAGLASLGSVNPELIPWAWGINGCASVISAALAVLLAIHTGFSGLVAVAMLLYLLAGMQFPARVERYRR